MFFLHTHTRTQRAGMVATLLHVFADAHDDPASLSGIVQRVHDFTFHYLSEFSLSIVTDSASDTFVHVRIRAKRAMRSCEG